MGGISGHINHPYEIFEPRKLIDFLNSLFKGELLASEKVDGINIYFGLDDTKNVVFARNKTEEPFSSIANRFTTNHNAYDAFSSGCSAIIDAINKLNDEELEDFSLLSNGKVNNFINAEIIYGEVPNIIKYSKHKNYIVFHSFCGNKERLYDEPSFAYDDIDQAKLLNKLANRLGTLETTSKIVEYSGKPYKTIKKLVSKKSKWEFKGPIEVNLSNSKSELAKLLPAFREHDSYQKLRHCITNEHEFLENDVINICKAATEYAGSLILSVLRSSLTDSDSKLTAGHPGVEGIVLAIPGEEGKHKIVKITGNYAELNNDMWEHLRYTIPDIKRLFTKTVLQRAFDIENLMSLTDASFRKYTKNQTSKRDIVKHFLCDRSKRYHNADFLVDTSDITIFNTLSSAIDEAQHKIELVWLDIHANNEKYKLKIDEIKRALLSLAHSLTHLKNNLSQQDTVLDMFLKVLISLFPIKFVRRYDGNIEAYNSDEHSYSSTNRVGVFIGKFDPPHLGHISIIREMLDENNQVLIFVSRVKNTLPFEAKRGMLKHYLHDNKLQKNVFVFGMDDGFIPDLIKNNFDSDKTSSSIFTIYSGSDRTDEYARQFRRFDKNGNKYWEHKYPRFKVVERDTENNNTKANDVLSLSTIPVYNMSSTLLKELVRLNTNDAYRVFMNTQPSTDNAFNFKVWKMLCKELGVNDGRQTTNY